MANSPGKPIGRGGRATVNAKDRENLSHQYAHARLIGSLRDSPNHPTPDLDADMARASLRALHEQAIAAGDIQTSTRALELMGRSIGMFRTERASKSVTLRVDRAAS